MNPPYDHDDRQHREDHDRGLAFDLSTLVQRRHVLKLLGGAALLTVGACRSGSDDGVEATSSRTNTTAAGSDTTAAASDTTAAGSEYSSDAGACTTLPEETAGPFPGDGSNGPNLLTASGVVRSDIRASIGSASGVADGVTLTLNLTISDAAGDCRPLPGAAVYLWHCDREARYSMYDVAIADENYLRGVQEADADGRVSFTTIFPGCYSGRWPHMHFEVYPSLDAATSAGDVLVTSQLAFPEDTCTAAYAADGYEQSVGNLQAISLESDMVFGDGVDAQLAAMSGSAQEGYTAELQFSV